MNLAHLIDLVTGAAHLFNGVLVALVLVAVRPWRIAVMSRIADVRVRRALAGLGATLWLFPLMFLTGGANRLVQSLGGSCAPLAVLYGVAAVLAAFHLASSLAFFARRAARVRRLG